MVWLNLQPAVLLMMASSTIGQSPPESRECLSNKDCPSDRLCAEYKCINPCLLNLCGDPSDCKISNHIPVCACRTDFSGPLNGGSTNKGKEEKAYVVHLEKMNWHGAVLHCASQGASLATIESQEEQDRLVNMINRTRKDDPKLNWWIGATDLHRPKDYVWFPSGRPIIYKNYYPGQPDNKVSPGDQIDHCLEIKEDLNFQWRDRTCYQPQYFVCEH